MLFLARAFAYDVLQRKVKGLEDDNRKLRAEASQLVSDSSESELREEQLLQDVLSQLGTSGLWPISFQIFNWRLFNVLYLLADANSHIRSLDDDLAKKYEESTKQREEISSLLAQLVSQRHKIREVHRMVIWNLFLWFRNYQFRLIIFVIRAGWVDCRALKTSNCPAFLLKLCFVSHLDLFYLKFWNSSLHFWKPLLSISILIK